MAGEAQSGRESQRDQHRRWLQSRQELRCALHSNGSWGRGSWSVAGEGIRLERVSSSQIMPGL